MAPLQQPHTGLGEPCFMAAHVFWIGHFSISILEIHGATPPWNQAVNLITHVSLSFPFSCAPVSYSLGGLGCNVFLSLQGI